MAERGFRAWSRRKYPDGIFEVGPGNNASYYVVSGLGDGTWRHNAGLNPLFKLRLIDNKSRVLPLFRRRRAKFCPDESSSSHPESGGRLCPHHRPRIDGQIHEPLEIQRLTDTFEQRLKGPPVRNKQSRHGTTNDSTGPNLQRNGKVHET